MKKIKAFEKLKVKRGIQVVDDAIGKIYLTGFMETSRQDPIIKESSTHLDHVINFSLHNNIFVL